jgi:hypothetical protein
MLKFIRGIAAGDGGKNKNPAKLLDPFDNRLVYKK